MSTPGITRLLLRHARVIDNAASHIIMFGAWPFISFSLCATTRVTRAMNCCLAGDINRDGIGPTDEATHVCCRA
jgi:hypothetical protein